MILSLLAWALLAQSAPAVAPSNLNEKTINVVAIGQSPGWGSGVTWTSTMILGRDDDGDIDPYFVTYFGPEDEPLPPLGSQCTIRYTTDHRLEIVGGLQTRPGLKGSFIDDFECSPPPDPDLELFRE